MATIFYAQQYDKAKASGTLVTEGEELDRLKRIAARLIEQSAVFRDDTKQWKWHLTLIDAPILNATCAPGGKITFYTGILRQPALTDDEIAAVMGHEIAHALREHGRERVSHAYAQKLINDMAAAKAQNKENQIQLANQVAHYLFVLPNSRTSESEADRIGLELMARAGYDPRAAITFWQKMTAAKRGPTPLEFLSTHPSDASRIGDLSRLLPVVQHLRAPSRGTARPTSLSAASGRDLSKKRDWCPEIDNFCDTTSSDTKTTTPTPPQP